VFNFSTAAGGALGANYVTNTDGSVTVLSGAGTGTYTITVDSGGAIGDNTVVFKITTLTVGLSVALHDAVLTQVKVKNLATTLGAGSSTATSSKVKLGAEFQVVTGTVGTGVTDTASAVDILASKPVLTLAGTATDASTRPLIQVAASEKKFTNNLGNLAKTDYDATNDVAYIDLGTLQIKRALDPALLPVNKENGLAFDFQGSDVIKLALTSATGWKAYDKVWLSTAACNAPAGLSVLGSTSATDGSVTINLSGQTTVQMETGYNVCAVALTTAVIPETNSITAQGTADFFNARYMDSKTAVKDYGVIRRNGCSVTLFNLPSVNASDDAFIRLTNVSGIAGSVRATIWKEDGTNADVDTQIAATIPAHGTVVLHTAADQATGTYLGTALPLFGAQTSGRDRIVLTGAFPACEALGLVRTPAGVLVNMTSTTYSGDSAQFGADTNGTSNTKN
jgi:hypothetical protein